MTGLKILKIDLNNIRFIDSLNLFMQDLASLPKAFGLNCEIVKGFFPHYFNQEKHWEYNGPMPPKDIYGPQYMNSKTQEFNKWYSKQTSFNFKLWSNARF